jgi:large subunit ribosomal protein L32e
MVDTKLIAHKQKVKARKPAFNRQETHRRNKLGTEWRKPKGVHSKLRLRRRGKGKMVSIGYRMPSEVRGLTSEGLRQVYVSNVDHLKYISKDEVALIKKVSSKNRLKILQAAQKASIRILNINDIAKTIEALIARISRKKVKQEEKTKKRAKKEEEEKKKAKMTQKQAELKKKGKDKTLESTVKSAETNDKPIKKLEDTKTEVKVEEKLVEQKDIKPSKELAKLEAKK